MYQNQSSYYDLLEVSPNADSKQILEAYQRAKEIYSPNSPALYSMFTEEEARELLRLVDEAYNTLSNRALKRAYDIKMGFITEDTSTAPSSPNSAPKGAAAVKVETKTVGRGEDGWDGSVKIHRLPDTTPEGYGKTRFGTYRIDEEIETAIRLVEECDGSFLERIRKYKQVSLEQLSEALKIGKSTLVALEQNDLAKLPVEVFTRGIVVQYAKMLCLDEQKIAKAYMVYYRAHNKPSP